MLGSTGSAVWGTGLVAPQRAGSFRTRDRTGVPRVAKQILNHWTTREGRLSILNTHSPVLDILMQDSRSEMDSQVLADGPRNSAC